MGWFHDPTVKVRSSVIADGSALPSWPLMVTEIAIVSFHAIVVSRTIRAVSVGVLSRNVVWIDGAKSIESRICSTLTS